MNTAKLFTNGASQAVRLSKAFRFDGATEVSISKRGDVYLRCLLTHGARSVLLTAQRKEEVTIVGGHAPVTMSRPVARTSAEGEKGPRGRRLTRFFTKLLNDRN